MKKLTFLSILALVALIVSSCGLGKMVPNNQATLKLEDPNLENRGGKVEYVVKGTVPPNFMRKKATVDIKVPVFMNEDGSDKTEINSIRLVGEKSKEQGTVIPRKTGGTFTVAGSFPFQEKLANQGIYGIGTARAGKKEFTYPPQKIGEGISNTSSRIGINPILSETAGNGTNILFAPHGYKAEFETETGIIYFEVNRHDLNWNLRLNKDKSAQEALSNLKTYLFNALDGNKKIQKIVVSGWASPEGEESLNQNLSQRRSEQGLRWLNNQLEEWRKEYAKRNKLRLRDVQMPQVQIENNAKGEDWSGFEAAVERSNIREKNQILNVVRSQTGSAAREQKIRNMTDIYTEIAEIILPPLRRAEISVTCNKNNFTDEEIVELVVKDPSKLTLNEKLFGASKITDLNVKEQIYTGIINDATLQNDWRAYNNLGALALNNAKLADARNFLDKASAISPSNGIVLNNMGILYFLEGKKDEAKKAFEASQRAQVELVKQDYNLGLFKILDGDFAGALQAMGNRSCDYGVALAQFMMRDFAAAKSNLDCVQPKDAKAFYLAAVIGARQNNENDVINNLQRAIELNSAYKTEAKKDAEFKNFRNNANFQNLVK
jgi:outer membrane protein OmpA-like peptidoglycan-associated protein